MFFKSSPFDRKKIHSAFYRPSIDKYSAGDIRALHWNSKSSQENRFHALLRIGELQDARILDIGCGTGDFLGFLQKLGRIPAYFHGIDLMPDFISVASHRYPHAHFETGDFFEKRFDKKYDYVFCNGALNVKEEDNLELLTQLISKAISLKPRGVGISLLKYSPHFIQDKKLFHYEEKKVQELLETHGKLVLHCDYAENDFIVFLYPSGE